MAAREDLVIRLEVPERPARGRLLAAAAAHRRLKRALGLLREASRALAPELADVDVVGELRITDDADVQALVELVRLARARARDRDLDVVLLSSPRPPDQELPRHA